MIFERLTGETTQYGTIIMNLKDDVSKSKEIVVEPSGIISIEVN
jgi:hypothetical protein